MDTSNPFAVSYKTSTSPVAEQQGRYNTLNQGFSDFVNNQPNASSLQTKYNDQFGVPQMQQQLQTGNAQYDYLGNQISGVGKDIQQGSQESILTQGQLSRMTQSRQQPLLEQQNMLGQNLSRLGQNLGTAQSNVSQMMTAEQADQQRQLQPWLQKYNTEEIMSAARMTGWTQENANELSVLLANQQAGLTWTNAERDRANQLAIAEKQYQQALEVAKINATSQMDVQNASNAGAYDRTKLQYADPFGLAGYLGR